MEPKQYNDKIYNKDVVLLRNRIRELEEKILDGRLQVATLQDFQSVFEETNKVKTEFKALCGEVPNQVYTSELNAYFAHEREFLDALFSFLLIFHNYHEAAGERFVTDALIQQEWEDVFTMIYACKVEQQVEDYFQWFNPSAERDYISNFIKDLNKKHDYIGPRPEKWQDMSLIESFQKLADELAKIDTVKKENRYIDLLDLQKTLKKELEENVFPRMKKIRKNTKAMKSATEWVKNMCDEVQREHQKKLVHSFSHILDAAENPAYYREQMKEVLDLSSVDGNVDYKKIRSKEYSDERKKDISLDMTFLNQLKLTSKIHYIRLVLQNIIKESGKVEGERLVKACIDGKEYFYPKQYQPHFEKYMSILSSLENQQKLKKQEAFVESASEERKNTSGISEDNNSTKELTSPFYGVDEILAEREAELKIKREEVESSMRFLEEEANGILNVDKLVSFPLEGKQVQILESDYVQYQTLYNKRKSIDLALAEIKMKYGYGNQENEDTYYANMNFMEENGVEKERQEEQKKFWGKKFYQTIIGNRNARFSDLLYILKSEKIPEEFQHLYSRIAFAPKEFLKSKKYTDQTKRKAFQNLRSIFSRFSEKENKSLNISAIVKKCNETILQAVATLPVNEAKATDAFKGEKKVFKIVKVRKSIDAHKKMEKKLERKQIAIAASICLAICSGPVLGAISSMFAKAPLVKPVDARVSIEKSIELENETLVSSNAEDYMTAGFVEDFLNFREQNKDWEISFKQDTDVYEMASAKALGNNTILTEQQSVVEEMAAQEEEQEVENIGMYGLGYIKSDAKIFNSYEEILKGYPGGECKADTTTPYKITGICYENGAWVSAEDAMYDPVAMNRAYDAQGVSKVGLRLVNPTTGEYIGYILVNDFEKAESLNRGGR